MRKKQLSVFAQIERKWQKIPKWYFDKKLLSFSFCFFFGLNYAFSLSAGSESQWHISVVHLKYTSGVNGNLSVKKTSVILYSVSVHCITVLYCNGCANLSIIRISNTSLYVS